jgi:large subunit ribosomal protein L22
MTDPIVTIKAGVTGLRVSPRKVGLVASLIRGRTVEDALVILEHTPKRAALPLSKLLKSARANALNNNSLVESSLRIHQLQVTAGPRLKRFNPAAMGRALPYQKRSSHIIMLLSGEVKAKKPGVAAKKADAKKEEA